MFYIPAKIKGFKDFIRLCMLVLRHLCSLQSQSLRRQHSSLYHLSFQIQAYFHQLFIQYCTILKQIAHSFKLYFCLAWRGDLLSGQTFGQCTISLQQQTHQETHPLIRSYTPFSAVLTSQYSIIQYSSSQYSILHFPPLRLAKVNRKRQKTGNYFRI